MVASVQWHSGTLRLWPKGVGVWGKTYEWVCSIVRDPESPTVAVLLGTMTSPPIDRLPEIAEALLKEGIEVVKWERRNSGKPRWVRFEVRQFAKGNE